MKKEAVGLLLVKQKTYKVSDVDKKRPGRYQTMSLPQEAGLRDGDEVMLYSPTAAGLVTLKKGDVVLRRVRRVASAPGEGV